MLVRSRSGIEFFASDLTPEVAGPGAARMTEWLSSKSGEVQNANWFDVIL